MDIEDAFTTEAITIADTNLSEVEERELRKVIVGSFDQPDNVIELAMLCFVAGRTYQTSNMSVPIFMSPAMVGAFCQYLLDRGAAND